MTNSDPNTEVDWTAPAAAMLISAVGALLIALSYQLSRNHVHQVSIVFWLGQAVMFAPLLAYVLRARSIAAGPAVWLVTFLAVESYLIKTFYSPLYLKFPDELLHVQGTNNALFSGHAGAANPGLPISSDYPGLQAISSALSAGTGLSANAVGFIVSGLLHVGFLLILFMLFREFNSSPRFALLAIMVYACNNGFLLFNSMYLYENLALPFMILAIYLAKRSQRSSRYPGLVIGGACFFIVLTVLSHHITAIFMSAVLLAVALLELRGSDRRAARPLIWLALFSCVVTAIWFVAISPKIFGYISPYTIHLGGSSNSVRIKNPVAGPGLHRPVLDALFGRSSVLLLGLLVLAFAALLIRRRGLDWIRTSWGVVMLLCALTLFISSAAAVVSARGGEISSRLSTFSYIGVAVVVAALFHHLLAKPARWTVPAIFLLGMYAYLGAVSNGWPPWWDRLPGASVGRGNESGVDGHTLQAADWARKNLPRNSQFSADANGAVVLASYGEQQLSSNSVQMFYAKTADTIVNDVHFSHTQFVWVDVRLPRLPSTDGLYFYSHQGPTYVNPPTDAQLALFDSVPGANLVYSDGTIKIYDMRGVK